MSLSPSRIPLCLKETDLIYEGIATLVLCFACVLHNSHKETDLIYEGIATDRNRARYMFDRSHKRN